MITCIATVLIGFTNPLTANDLKVIKSAQFGCARIYKDAPCLKTLIKKKDGAFNAICGGPKK